VLGARFQASGDRFQGPGIRGQGQSLILGQGSKKTTMAIKSYRDLQVWQKAMDLVVESYKVVNVLPKKEVDT
jgi:hypothetical protein